MITTNNDLYKSLVADKKLDTLADNETNKARQNHVIVNGEGSGLSKADALQARAKRKTITQSIMLKLIDLAKDNEKPDLKKRAKETTTAQIYIKALNNILVAMKGKRIFERFGFDIPKEQTTKKTPAKLLSSFKEWQYNSKSCDWENIKTGELLTGFVIPSHLQALLENNINLEIK